MDTVIAPDNLQYLNGRVAAMLPFRGKQDVESLATLGAKRRFLRIELEVAGIHPDHVNAEQVGAARELGCDALADYLQSLQRLNSYARSEARRKWNSSATENDLASSVPVASDWFLESTFPAEWDAMDFLSRCESIWREQGFTGEGMMFTRIFNHRVKMLTGYEDGTRLVLLATLVGDYVPPLDIPVRKEPRVEPIDLVRRGRAYDGEEPQDYGMLIQVPLGKREWAFSFGEIANHRFLDLKEIIGDAAWNQILEKQGFRAPRNEFETYTGDDRLPIYYYVRNDEVAGARRLILVGMGEFQPGRYIVNVEGFWRVFDSGL